MRATSLSTTLLLLLAACGPTTSSTDGGADAGEDGGLDGGSTDCNEAWRLCQLEFRFRAIDESSVEVRGSFRPNGWMQGVRMVRDGDTWKASVPVPYGAAVEYKFLVNNSVWVTDPANPKTRNGNSLVDALTCNTWTCEDGAPSAQAFDWRDAVIYFVFVDRFLDADPSNNCTVAGADPAGQYQGGDWKGVTRRIDEGYFTQLGVNALWLTVPVKNPTVAGRGADGRTYSGYHGYWPVDLDALESCFGTEADLKALVDAAHAKGIQVLFDFAMVHLHSSAPVFQQHPEWFWPLDFGGNQCVCGFGCDWNAQGERCWFTDYLPHWNYTVPAARDYSVGRALALVERTGADGFRLDAIKHVDGSWLLELRRRLSAEVVPARTPRPRFYLVGETYDFGNRDYLKSFVDVDTKMDGQFDFPLRLKLLQAVVMRQTPLTDLSAFVESNDAFYGPKAVMSTWIGNHDLGRVIHMAEDTPLWVDPYADGKDRAWNNPPAVPGYRRPFERLANAFVFLFTSPGAPLLYYGDEVGLPGAGDPDNRRTMTWAGLTADQLWLRGRVEKLGELRKRHAALRHGQRATLSVTADTWVYSMTKGAEVVYVALNRGDTDATVTGLPAGALVDEYTGVSVSGPSVQVPARSARVLVTP
ncbi:MAG: alpha-amylase family glycosyl hydrolase [Myxococcota bacterium]